MNVIPAIPVSQLDYQNDPPAPEPRKIDADMLQSCRPAGLLSFNACRHANRQIIKIPPLPFSRKQCQYFRDQEPILGLDNEPPSASDDEQSQQHRKDRSPGLVAGSDGLLVQVIWSDGTLRATARVALADTS